jgi:hypothetical protein
VRGLSHTCHFKISLLNGATLAVRPLSPCAVSEFQMTRIMPDASGRVHTHICLHTHSMLLDALRSCRCESKEEESCPLCDRPRIGEGGRKILKVQSLEMVMKRLYENREGACGF